MAGTGGSRLGPVREYLGFLRFPADVNVVVVDRDVVPGNQRFDRNRAVGKDIAIHIEVKKPVRIGFSEDAYGTDTTTASTTSTRKSANATLQV